MKVIILAAGNSAQMSGTIKCLIKNPFTGKTCLKHIIEAFSECDPVITVGYRAVEIMQDYPHAEYVYNSDWSVTGPCYSLGMALSDEPCYIVPGDIIVGRSLVEHLNQAPPNCVLTRRLENRDSTITNFITENGIIREAYAGFVRNSNDPAGTGIFKISDIELLRSIKQNCLNHGAVHIGMNVNYDMPGADIYNVDLGAHDIIEFNNYLDYMIFLKVGKEMFQ